MSIVRISHGICPEIGQLLAGKLGYKQVNQ